MLPRRKRETAPRRERPARAGSLAKRRRGERRRKRSGAWQGVLEKPLHISSVKRGRLVTTDQQAERAILLQFIPSKEGSEHRARMMAAWRRGDADALARDILREFHDQPSFAERLINQRNRNWIPKIEEYLTRGKNYFVVVGAGHMGGPNGLLALLRAGGYTIEQL